MMRAVSVERADPLQWCHNGRDCVSNHQPHDCLLNRIFRRRSKKSSKFHVTDLSVGNQWASNVENVSIWRCHHALNGRANDKCLSQAIIEKEKFDICMMDIIENGIINDYKLDIIVGTLLLTAYRIICHTWEMKWKTMQGSKGDIL